MDEENVSYKERKKKQMHGWNTLKEKNKKKMVDKEEMN